MPSRDDPSPPDESSRSATAAAEHLRRLIAPEVLGDDRFGIDTSGLLEGHLFGGLVAAQSINAAYTTVEAPRRLQSLHAYFLRRGRPDLPIEFEVHRDTDGRAFSARRVAALQEGRPIFTTVCSFHVPEETAELLQPLPGEVGPPPTAAEELTADLGGVFELRRELVEGDDHEDHRVSGSMWVRAVGPLPDDPVVHDCLLLYASDLGTPWHVAKPQGMGVGPSLDHSVWLHRRSRMDEWHHLRHDPMALADARGLYTGRMWRADGTHVATIAQENLLRPV